MALPLRYNFRSLLRRKTRAVMTALGIGLAVLVSMLMLALSTGLMNSIRATGHPLNVLVTSKGTETTEFSAIDLRVLDVLRFSPYVALKDGQPLASPELYFTTQIETAPGVPSAPALVRGVLPLALVVNDQVRVTAGRFPNQPGEIMVGPLVWTNLGLSPERLAIGQSLIFEGTPWKIVGQFTAPGTAFESEIWGPLDNLMVAARRSELSSIVLRAKDAAALKEVLFDFATRSGRGPPGNRVLRGLRRGVSARAIHGLCHDRDVGVGRDLRRHEHAVCRRDESHPRDRCATHCRLSPLGHSPCIFDRIADPRSGWRRCRLPACAGPERICPAYSHGRIPI
jgi:hypothetical protein